MIFIVYEFHKLVLTYSHQLGGWVYIHATFMHDLLKNDIISLYMSFYDGSPSLSSPTLAYRYDLLGISSYLVGSLPSPCVYLLVVDLDSFDPWGIIWGISWLYGFNLGVKTPSMSIVTYNVSFLVKKNLYPFWVSFYGVKVSWTLLTHCYLIEESILHIPKDGSSLMFYN